MRIFIKEGSLTDGDESVLVNASNTNAQLGTGVSAAIRQACGKGYQEKIFAALEEKFHGPMKPGEVLLTDAGTHPRAAWVAHVAVMDYRWHEAFDQCGVLADVSNGFVKSAKGAASYEKVDQSHVTRRTEREDSTTPLVRGDAAADVAGREQSLRDQFGGGRTRRGRIGPSQREHFRMGIQVRNRRRQPAS